MIKRIVTLALMSLTWTILLPSGAWAQERQERPPGPFDQGQITGTISGGTSVGSGDTYLVIGAAIGYFVLDGLELGVEVESWLLADPTINKLSPRARYIFYMVPHLQPYLQTFYRHWFVSDQDDLDTVGGGAGVAFVSSRNFYVGGGVVHEIVVSSCEVDCSETYPEFFIGASF